MRFACESCLTRYTLADEKVKDRELKIRCKTCGAVMVVRDPALAKPEAPAFADEATRTLSPEEAMRLARQAAGTPQAPAPSSESSWDEQPTRNMPAEEAMRRAQEYRLAWSVVRAPEENLGVAHWRERDYFVPIDHPQLPDAVPYPRGPWRWRTAAHEPRRRAPDLGEHTDSVLRDWLGVEPAELATLRKDGVIA